MMAHNFQTKDIVLEGLKLSYVEWGNPDSPAIVLMHGLQDCARSWDYFASSMSSDYRVICLDSRGHGDSGRPLDGSYKFDDYVSDLEILLANLGLASVLLIGHSAGGRYVYTYGARHPDKVRGLVVVDIDPDSVNSHSSDMLDRYHNETDMWPSLQAVVDRLKTRQPLSSHQMLFHQAKVMTKSVGLNSEARVWKRDRSLLEAYERPDLWAEWRDIKCPTVIIRGRQSKLLDHHTAVKMRETLPGCKLAELEGGGHWFYQESPGAFEDSVRWFLVELDRQKSF